MPEKTCNFELRRTLLKGALATGVLVTLRANAAELPPVSANDPAAKALRYVDDATSLPAGTRKDATHVCTTCRFYTDAKAVRGPCTLFPGKSVGGAGWCQAWAARP